MDVTILHVWNYWVGGTVAAVMSIMIASPNSVHIQFAKTASNQRQNTAALFLRSMQDYCCYVRMGIRGSPLHDRHSSPAQCGTARNGRGTSEPARNCVAAMQDYNNSITIILLPC